MTTSESSSEELPDQGPSDEFGSNALQNLWDIFWNPELERRGGVQVTGSIHRALVVLGQGSAPEVRFNDEFELGAKARVNSPVQPGDALTADNVDQLEKIEPIGVDPNAGWATFVLMPDGTAYMSFDFRRNRQTANELLDLADQYFDSAKSALDRGHLGPTIDALHTTAELAVTAMMYLSDDDPLAGNRNRHGKRIGWLNDFTRHGNAPRDFHSALKELFDLRPAARYGSPALARSEDATAGFLQTVSELVLHARRRVGDVAFNDDGRQSELD